MGRVSLDEGIRRLKEGQVVAIPTETVYGLAGRVGSVSAIAEIFQTKKRPFFDPLIVHVASAHEASRLASTWGPLSRALTKAFWPGPLTVVVPKSEIVDPRITSGLATVALRCPKHPTALTIIEGVGEPLAAPSANMFGRTSPTRAEHVVQNFEGRIPVVDGGPCEIGVESTVIEVIEPRASDFPQGAISLLRPGVLALSEIEDGLLRVGLKPRVVSRPTESSPGHLEHHYQPQKPLIIVSTKSQREELNQYARQLGVEPTFAWLRLSSDPRLAARELYHQMFLFDQAPESVLVFETPPDWANQRWDAIRDRLEKAQTLKGPSNRSL